MEGDLEQMPRGHFTLSQGPDTPNSSQESWDELVTSFRDISRRVVECHGLWQEDFHFSHEIRLSSSWEEAGEASALPAAWPLTPVLCPASPTAGGLWLQVPRAGRECPGPRGSACLFTPLASCLCGRHGHTSGPLC